MSRVTSGAHQILRTGLLAAGLGVRVALGLLDALHAAPPSGGSHLEVVYWQKMSELRAICERDDPAEIADRRRLATELRAIWGELTAESVLDPTAH